MWLRLGGRARLELCLGPDYAQSLPALPHGRWVGSCGHRGVRLGTGPSPSHISLSSSSHPLQVQKSCCLLCHPSWSQSPCCPHSTAQLHTSPSPKPLLQEPFPQGAPPAPRALSPLSRHKRAEPGKHVLSPGLDPAQALLLLPCMVFPMYPSLQRRKQAWSGEAAGGVSITARPVGQAASLHSSHSCCPPCMGPVGSLCPAA